MKYIVLSIHDSAVGAYLRPMFVNSEGAGLRVFMDEVNRKDSDLFKHPDHYTLFRIGTFDDSSGVLSSNIPVSLGNGLQFKEATSVISGERIDSLFLAIQRIEESLNKE